MCTHYSFAQELVSEMTENVFKTIDLLFLNIEGDLDPVLIDLKIEFYSLRTYEDKLVFPEVLKVFNTKNSNFKSNANIKELISLTQKKETKILEFLQILDSENSEKEGPMKDVIQYFFDSYFPIKKQWYAMLDNLNTTCACFIQNSEVFKN